MVVKATNLYKQLRVNYYILYYIILYYIILYYIDSITPTCFGHLWPSSGRWITKDILQTLFEPPHRSTLRLYIGTTKLFGVLINMIINDLDVL